MRYNPKRFVSLVHEALRSVATLGSMCISWRRTTYRRQPSLKPGHTVCRYRPRWLSLNNLIHHNGLLKTFQNRPSNL